jgi:polysaccharide export outer membrane protein
MVKRTEVRKWVFPLALLLLAPALGGAQAQDAELSRAEREAEAVGTAVPARSASVREFPLGVGDVLRLEVFGVPELTRRLRVDESGGVSVPLLGSVEIAGLSVSGAEDLLAQRLVAAQLIKNPAVDLLVEEAVSLGVPILGAVGRPGIHRLRGRGTLLEMLAVAGGVTGEASGDVLLQRSSEQGEKTLSIDGERLLQVGDPAYNIRLQPGDRLLVPRRRIARVFVAGEVERQGSVDFDTSEGLSLLQAVAAAGGARGKGEATRIIREGEDGARNVMRYSLRLIVRGEEDPMLEDNDLIIVGD